MKPACRILFATRCPAPFRFISAKCNHAGSVGALSSFRFGFGRCLFHTNHCGAVNVGRTIDKVQSAFCLPGSGFGWYGNLLKSHGFHGDISQRGVIVVANSVRSLSTSVETRVNDKNFERIYVQGGMNVKPVVVERIDKDENIVGGEDSSIEVVDDNINLEKSKAGLNESSDVSAKREESQIEKEAWRLLQDAVVMYCGSPVGTMAANDPGDKQPLNYDQVFIRDFVPSALAFLLKGEGDIVRNFLLHTLQLQVRLCLAFASPINPCAHVYMSLNFIGTSLAASFSQVLIGCNSNLSLYFAAW